MKTATLKWKRQCTVGSLLLCGLLSGGLQRPACAASFEIIGEGAVTGMSDNGQVMVGLTPDARGIWRWTAATGRVVLALPTEQAPGAALVAPDVTHDGALVSGAGNNLWSTEQGWQLAVGDNDQPTATANSGDGQLQALSGDGSVIVRQWLTPPPRDFPVPAEDETNRLIGSGAVRHPRADDECRGVEANQDGSLIVGWCADGAPNGHRPTVWSEHGAEFLTPQGVWGEALATSPNGRIVAGTSYDRNTNQITAALWLHSDYGWVQEFLGILPGTIAGFGRAVALDLSADGAVVVGRNRYDRRRSVGFVWTPDLGLMAAQDFLARQGVEVPAEFAINAITCVSPDGTTMAGVGVDEGAWPQEDRSFLVRGVKAIGRDRPRNPVVPADMGPTGPLGLETR